MSWFFSRRKPRSEFQEEVGVNTGVHRSPGLAALAEELGNRQVNAILDLGPSFNENVTFLSRFCSNIVIRDLVGARGEELSAPRASILELDVDTLDVEAGTRYDVILLWDLLHYVVRSEQGRFAARLAGLARPGGLALLLASGSTPIPLTPVKFKIQGPDALIYEVGSDSRLPSPHFTPRGIEQLMTGFRPVRFFQLRNGLQELLLRYEGSAEEQAAEQKSADETKPAPAAPKQPGDWY